MDRSQKKNDLKITQGRPEVLNKVLELGGKLLKRKENEAISNGKDLYLALFRRRKKRS